MGTYLRYELIDPPPDDESVMGNIVRLVGSLSANDPDRIDMVAFMLAKASAAETERARGIRALLGGRRVPRKEAQG